MKKKLTIIGGGITGLSAAYLAAKYGWEVTVLEGGAQLGGLIRTFQIGGNLLENYYHHFFANDAELLWLLRELNIIDKLEFRQTTIGVFRDSKIYDFTTPGDLFKFNPMGMVDKIRFMLSSLYLGKIARWEKWEGTAALDWFYKYAGRNATDTVWKPLLEIKFGSHANRIPTAWMVGRLKQRMNSRKGKDEHLGYIKGSLQTLTDTLKERLTELGVKILLNARLEKLLIQNSTLSGVDTAKGVFSGGCFLATIPTTHLVPMLQESSPQYAEELSRVEYNGAVCTVLEIDRPLSHIYWLNVADTGFPFGGIIEHTNFISPDEYGGSHILYISKYFDHNDRLASAPRDEIVHEMLEPLKRINPDFNKSWIKNVYFFRTMTAATVCGLNFSKIVPKCRTPVKNLYLVNMSHIYPDERSCNNAIRIAAQACGNIGIDTSMVPHGTSLSGQIGMG